MSFAQQRAFEPFLEVANHVRLSKEATLRAISGGQQLHLRPITFGTIQAITPAQGSPCP